MHRYECAEVLPCTNLHASWRPRTSSSGHLVVDRAVASYAAWRTPRLQEELFIQTPSCFAGIGRLTK
jgi:hypothetical protein